MNDKTSTIHLPGHVWLSGRHRTSVCTASWVCACVGHTARHTGPDLHFRQPTPNDVPVGLNNDYRNHVVAIF